MDSENIVPLPVNDAAATQQIYDALADQVQDLKRRSKDTTGRFTFWVITATVNLLCRLAIGGTSMTKEQLLQVVDEIFTGYKEGKAQRRLAN